MPAVKQIIAGVGLGYDCLLVTLLQTNDALVEILKVIKRNKSITDWNLSATGLKRYFIKSLNLD